MQVLRRPKALVLFALLFLFFSRTVSVLHAAPPVIQAKFGGCCWLSDQALFIDNYAPFAVVSLCMAVMIRRVYGDDTVWRLANSDWLFCSVDSSPLACLYTSGRRAYCIHSTCSSFVISIMSALKL